MSMVLLLLQSINIYIKECDEFEYLRIKINNKPMQDDMKCKINQGLSAN